MQPNALAVGRRTVRDADYHYLFRVRRLTVGDSVTLFDGAGGEAAAVVAEIHPDHAMLEVAEPALRERSSSCDLTIALAMIKGERMDWCIQKLVELGVSRIIPLHTARTVVDLRGPRADKRRRRYASIAAAAARQSRRAWLPEITEITELAQLWPRLAEREHKLALWTGESDRSLIDA
ncbi:MAG: RsmE family RNA methyltransferase, partial [Myxococcota bacterium]